MNNARMLLTKVRGGDYLHAGDKEAVLMVLERVRQLDPEVSKGPCLDVGSGFGGTAQLFHERGFKSIWGVDIDKAAIQYSQEHYPEIRFISTDVHTIPTHFEPDFFSFIYAFNLLYAIEDKASLLQELSSVAKPGALLVLFDYTANEESFSYKDLANKPIYPMVVSRVQEDLNKTGWEVLEVVDLSDRFLKWYQALLQKLEEESPALSQQFSQEDIARVKTTFTKLCEWMQDSSLGGAVIYARKIESN